MKKTIVVIDKEYKISKAGKKYLRVKDGDNQWMSAFDEDVMKYLDSNMGCPISVEIITNDEKGFKNIRKIYENSDGIPEFVATNASPRMVPNNQAQVNRPDRNITMYVSYAKDIFLKMVDTHLAEKGLVTDNPEEMMAAAVKLVKQAKAEFEKPPEKEVKEE